MSNITNKSLEGASPSQDWNKLKLEILEKIKELDLKSDRRNTEDNWWLEMSTFKRLLQQSIK